MSDLPQRAANTIGKVSKLRWYWHRTKLTFNDVCKIVNSYFIGLMFLLSQKWR